MSAPRAIVLRVEGMSCGGCVGGVTDALNRVPGAENVAVDLDAGTATLTLRSGDGDGDAAALVAAVAEHAGKTASLVSDAALARTVTLDVAGMSCGGCAGSVRDALAGVSGASNVAVDLEGKTASVEFAGDAAVLVAAVNATGKSASLPGK